MIRDGLPIEERVDQAIARLIAMPTEQFINVAQAIGLTVHGPYERPSQ